MIGHTRQSEIYVDGVSGRRPCVPVSERALEAKAIEMMSPEAAAYIVGGAGREDTMDANRRAFTRWQIVPRVLRDVEHRDASTTVLGITMPMPLMTAPIGVLELAHRDADRAVARAAAGEGIPMIFSSQASVAMEMCAAVMGDAPRLFQLYWSRSDDLVQSFVRRAEACGCRGIVLTLDTTMLGWRPRDLDLGYTPFMRGMGIAQYLTDPVFRRELDLPLSTPAPQTRLSLHTLGVLRDLLSRAPGPLLEKLRTGWPRQAVRRFVATYSRPSLQWADLARLRAMTTLPIVLKGVLHPEDARLALEHGVDGIVVSNHGGRQIDGEIASLDALPAISTVIDRRIPILLDSGVRGGADVFKAVALGASAVLLGRPYVYGLAIAGEAGVREVLRNIRAEFDLTMGLAGVRSVAEITSGLVAPAPER
ncbi:MAG: alpha-hydroxy-acid oxidizing protein [Gemmatimonadaceae bacterium]|nr:alpha-hydroxy-acid oxidizing protein [Gemmatimonadaceae bacterium]